MNNSIVFSTLNHLNARNLKTLAKEFNVPICSNKNDQIQKFIDHKNILSQIGSGNDTDLTPKELTNYLGNFSREDLIKLISDFYSDPEVTQLSKESIVNKLLKIPKPLRLDQPDIIKSIMLNLQGKELHLFSQTNKTAQKILRDPEFQKEYDMLHFGYKVENLDKDYFPEKYIIEEPNSDRYRYFYKLKSPNGKFTAMPGICSIWIRSQDGSKYDIVTIKSHSLYGNTPLRFLEDNDEVIENMTSTFLIKRFGWSSDSKFLFVEVGDRSDEDTTPDEKLSIYIWNIEERFRRNLEPIVDVCEVLHFSGLVDYRRAEEDVDYIIETRWNSVINMLQNNLDKVDLSPQRVIFSDIQQEIMERYKKIS